LRNDSRTGKTRVWRIAADGKRIITVFGELDGKLQEVVDYGQPKNTGRSNALTAEEDAAQEVERRILNKKRKGYVELGGEAKEEKIHPDRPLPTNLSFYKPGNTLSTALMKKLASLDGRVVLTRKRDGERFLIRTTGDGSIEMYSSKMLTHHHLEGPDKPWTARFPGVAYAVRALNLPPNTILLGELVPDPDTDDRWYVASVMKSKTPEALQIQLTDRNLRFYAWDVAMWNGELLLADETYDDRSELLHVFLSGNEWVLPPDVWAPIQTVEWMDDFVGEGRGPIKPPESPYGEYWDEEAPYVWNCAVAVAVAHEWEGWVVVDATMPFGDKTMNFRGKTYRPTACSGKLKPYFEDDVIAHWDPENGEGAYGNGKRSGLIGSVSLYQISEDGDEVYLCECGNGLLAEKAFYEDPKNNDRTTWPRVLEVRYETRTYESNGDDTNALQFPRALRQRDDKGIPECVNPRL